MWFCTTTWSKSHVTGWVKSPYGKPPSGQFGGHRYCDSGDICFKWVKSKVSHACLNPQLLFISKV